MTTHLCLDHVHYALHCCSELEAGGRVGERPVTQGGRCNDKTPLKVVGFGLGGLRRRDGLLCSAKNESAR